MKRISVVIPAYNEADCVDELARRLKLVFDGYAGTYEFEAIVVENGSRDATYEKLLAIRADDPRFKIIQLARNFNMEGGMTAGLAYATGDAAVIMSADLQDPPELIPLFIEKWEEGYENVYGIVTRREDNSLFRRAAASTFYAIINKVSDQPVPRNASDFRLVDRRVYEAFNAMPERMRMIRAMWGWLGFKSCGIEHERPPRFGGTSAFNTFVVAGFAVRGILASSMLPLKFIPAFGFLCAALSFVALLAIFIRAFIFGVPFPGFGTIIAFNALLFGLLFLFLGLIAEYVGMIYQEVRMRPTYIVRHLNGIGDPRSADREPQHFIATGNGAAREDARFYMDVG
jgi:dolichol-phosphate mannosyltransferase